MTVKQPTFDNQENWVLVHVHHVNKVNLTCIKENVFLVSKQIINNFLYT